MKHVTIREALQHVADNPVMSTDEMLQVRVHELVSRTLFEIANRADTSSRGSLSRANRARKMIMNRLVGLRRPGSHPATRKDVAIEFLDLTSGAIKQ